MALGEGRTRSASVQRAAGKGRTPDQAMTRAMILKVDQALGKQEASSEKAVLQQELGYMRAQLKQDRTTVNVTYPVNPPYAFIQVRFDQEAGEFDYHVHEPALRPEEEDVLHAIRDRMEALTDEDEMPVIDLSDLGRSPALQQYLHKKFLYAIDLYDIPVPEDRRRTLFYYLQRDLVGLGRSDGVMRDPFVEDVSCNGPGLPVYVFHRVFGSVKTSVVYENELELNRYILKLAQMSGKHISVYQPILDATLTDGSRLNLTLGTEVTRRGSTFSIRKFTADPISPIDLIRFGSASAAVFAYFWHLIENKRSILVSGGTASGKTTMLNALSMFIRPEDKIVSIEDTPEVHLSHSNWIQSVSRAGYGMAATGASGAKPGAISLFDLLVAALRQRPEYILVGEVRGTEASTLFQAISTGHAAMATIHAANMEELLHRIENEPMNIPRVLVEALDAVVFPGQVVKDGQRLRRVRGVTEVLEVDASSGNLLTNDVFGWEPRSDDHRFSGRSFTLERIGKASGKSLEEVEADVAMKTRYLEAMARKDITNFKDVTRRVNEFYLDAPAALARLEEAPHGR